MQSVREIYLIGISADSGSISLTVRSIWFWRNISKLKVPLFIIFLVEAAEKSEFTRVTAVFSARDYERMPSDFKKEESLKANDPFRRQWFASSFEYASASLSLPS